MLSPVIKSKIQARYKQEVKYAKQCEALAAHINSTCKCKISASTIKRLWGFIKGQDTQPRIWTLDIIAEYIGYKSWEELEDELVGNKTKKNKRIESVECSLLKPGKCLIISFGKTVSIKIEYLGKNWFEVHEENKTSLRINDEIYLEKIQLDLPMHVIKVKRTGTTRSGFVLGGVTGVTEIIDTDGGLLNSSKQTNGLLTSK